jgi:preprotein translocase subunit SecG
VKEVKMSEIEQAGNKNENGRIYLLCFVLILLVFCTAGAASDMSQVMGEDAVAFGERAGTWNGQTIFAWLSFILGVGFVLLLVWHGYCNQQDRKLWLTKTCELTQALVQNTEMMGEVKTAVKWCEHHSGKTEADK